MNHESCHKHLRIENKCRHVMLVCARRGTGAAPCALPRGVDVGVACAACWGRCAAWTRFTLFEKYCRGPSGPNISSCQQPLKDAQQQCQHYSESKSKPTIHSALLYQIPDVPWIHNSSPEFNPHDAIYVFPNLHVINLIVGLQSLHL